MLGFARQPILHQIFFLESPFRLDYPTVFSFP